IRFRDHGEGKGLRAMPTRPQVVKTLAFVFALLAMAVCARPNATSRQPQIPAAFSGPIGYLSSDSSIGYRCLPRGGDSMLFRVQVIVDSAQLRESGEFGVILNGRAPARPGYIYQGVTVEIQLAGSTRIRGTSCWHDAGILFRATPRTLERAI